MTNHRQPPKLKDAPKAYLVIIEMAFAAARGKAIALFSLMAVLGLQGAMIAWVSRIVVDGIAQAESTRALVFGGIFLAVVALQTLVSDMLQVLQVDMADRIGHEVDLRLMKVAAGAPGLDHLERSEFADRMKQVRERQWIPANLLQQIGALSVVIFGIISSVFLLATIHGALALLPLVMVPSAALQFRAYRKHWNTVLQASPEQRLADHYLKLSTHPTGAKEIRLFGLRPHFLAEHERLSRSYVRTLFNARLKQASGSTFGGLLYGAALTVAIGFIGSLALDGRASPGDVALGVQVARLALGHVEMAAELIVGLAEMGYMGKQYTWLLRYKPELTVRDDGTEVAPPQRIVGGIEFENVTFKYPGTEKSVLKNVSLSLPPGSTVAVVGENGAGKSSLVKLLARFYDPSEGRITVDGVDLREVDLAAWRETIASSFQDFVRFEFVAREAVGVGDLPRIDDEERVAAAVTFAGADRVLQKLPDGLGTQLGRQFTGGHDLSEGEWQRVALARGSMRTEPALIILDEPTASLDARAEHEVFERFRDLAAPSAEGTKPVTLLVSHRFSTVRMADLIVVLHEGEIEEVGSHDELIAADGRYGELFKMQASRYEEQA